MLDSESQSRVAEVFPEGVLDGSEGAAAVVENLARTPNRSPGLYTEGENCRIWVRR